MVLSGQEIVHRSDQAAFEVTKSQPLEESVYFLFKDVNSGPDERCNRRANALPPHF